MTSGVAKFYAYRHTIGFEETNVVGNVYYARHVAWQGACREMFLRDHAPGILNEIYVDLRLVTLSVHCDYFQELRAFDTVELRMRLDRVTGNRIALEFDYRVDRDEGWLQCALGRQEIGCMRETWDKGGNSAGLSVCEVPQELLSALEDYRVSSF